MGIFFNRNKEKKGLEVKSTAGTTSKVTYDDNLFGKDVSNKEVWALLENQSEEDNIILFTAAIFLSCLEENCSTEVLQSFIHPAALRDWGDFSGAREFIDSLSEIGFSTRIRYNDRHDMAYVYLLENITDGILLQEYQIIKGITTVTFVKEKENQRWLIYSIGEKLDDYIVTIEPLKEIKKGILKLAQKMNESELFQ